MNLNNHNRPGYKKTKVGWIPMEWECPSFGDIFEIQLGKMLSKKAREARGQSSYLANFNVRWGGFDLSDVRTMAFSQSEKEKFELRDGDLLVCEGGEIGRCAIWHEEISPCYFQKALHRLRPRKKNVSPFFAMSFLYKAVRTPRIRGFIGETSFAHLTREQFIALPIPLPPLPEQKAIAEILECWDKAIREHERKLEKKRIIKKGLMQRLLSGKQRLPGFDREWKEVRLGEVLHEHKETSSGRETVYSVSVHKGLVNQVEHMGRSFAAVDTSRYNLVKPGDIVYTKSPTGDFPYGIIKQSRLSESVIVSPLYGVFTPVTTSLGLLLDCYFESKINTGNYLRPIIQKGAKNTINITNSTFLSNRLALPTQEQEQSAIASVFICLEKEIAILVSKLAALKSQKRFLLNNLVTGTIRLPQFVNKTSSTADSGDAT